MNILFNRWVLIFLCVVALLVGFFWHDVFDQSMDTTAEFVASDVEAMELQDRDVATLRSFQFERSRNDDRQIKVSDIHLVSRSDAMATISLTLGSRIPNTDFPSLRISLYSPSNKLLRNAVVPPEQYQRSGSRLGRVPVKVEISLPVQAGETGFSVRPFFVREASNG